MECKLPLDAKSTVCRGKPNSHTVITEQAFDMKVQYYHWILAWSGSAVAVFLEIQYFFVNEGREIGQILNMSFSHSEVNAKTPPGVNQGDVSQACHGHFPWTHFSFVHKLQNMQTDSCQPGCSLRQICRPGCGIFSTQTLLLHVPLTGKLCSAPPPLIWGSPNGRQLVSSGVSLLKHRRGGSSGQRRWRRPNETQQQQRWTLITKTAVPFKKNTACEGFVVAQLKLFHSGKQQIFHRHEEDNAHPLPSIGHYFLWEGFLTNVLEDVSKPTPRWPLDFWPQQ